MSKIGILFCNNLKQDLSCSSVKCFEGLNTKNGIFSMYEDDDNLELAGTINCAGCPTAVAPEKILEKVTSLAACGIEKLHFSSCMNIVCPFKNKYKSIIQDTYPDIEVIYGTHGAGTPEEFEQEQKMFKTMVKDGLSRPKTSLTSLAQEMGLMPAGNKA